MPSRRSTLDGGEHPYIDELGRTDAERYLTDIHDGKIIIDSRGLIKKASGNTYAGTFSGTSRGFGFVRIDGE